MAYKPTVPAFPTSRLRRLRSSPALRSLVRENAVTSSDFIWPVFVMDGVDDETSI
ncbi:MAG: porphobilinogen synthase, partial [Planktomarina sp.]